MNAYTIEETGGNCTAFVRELQDGRIVVVTNGDCGHKLVKGSQPTAAIYASREEWDDSGEAVWESTAATYATLERQITEYVGGEVPPLPTTEAEAAAFIGWAAQRLGGGFHPDTRASDYGVFSPDEADQFDAAMDETFGLLDDPYSVALDAMHN